MSELIVLSNMMLMRKLFITAVLINLVFFPSSAQIAEGKWKIDFLITDSLRNVYKLSPLDTTVRWDYGNHLTLEDGGVFRTSYSAPCGNDCFTSTTGEFVFTDQDHIKFKIDTIARRGFCSRWPESATFPFNVGSFYVDRDGEGVRLIKSDGDLKQDELNLSYIDSIEVFHEKSMKFHDFAVIIKPDSNFASSPENIANLYASEIGANNYKILYSQKTGFRALSVLIGIDKEFHYVFSSSTGSYEDPMIYQIAYYNWELAHSIKNRADAIDSKIRRFEVQEIRENKGSFEEVITIFRKKEEIKKVVFKKVFSDGEISADCYVENGAIVFVDIIYDFNRNGKKQFSRMEFYKKDEGGYASREITRSGSGIHRSEVHSYVSQLRELLEKKN